MSDMFFNSKYLYPFSQINDLNIAISGYNDVLKIHERNQSLQGYLKYGKCESLDDLFEAFHDYDDILSQIKLKSLECPDLSECHKYPATKIRF